MSVRQGRNFVFTWYDLGVLPESVLDKTVNLVYQQEECPTTKKHHYQGYVEFKGTKTLSALKKISDTTHWENRMGTREEAYAYCQKDATRVEDGVSFSNFAVEDQVRGRRTDLILARAKILTKRSVYDVYQDEELTDVCCKYPHFVDRLMGMRKRPKIENFTLRPWQAHLMELIREEPDDRTIYWFYDTKGNVGKSTMATYLQRNENAMVVSNGKTGDIAHVYDGQPIIIWDLSRSQEEHVNYGPMEDFKNGRIFSPKYDSCVKEFAPPHVLVFANFPCPLGKFSEDRVISQEIGSDGCFVEHISKIVGESALMDVEEDSEEKERVIRVIEANKLQRKSVKAAGIKLMLNNMDRYGTPNPFRKDNPTYDPERPKSPSMFDFRI